MEVDVPVLHEKTGAERADQVYFGSGGFPDVDDAGISDDPSGFLCVAGALMILLIFALLVWRGITLSLRAKDKFGKLLGIGLTSQIGIQVVLNILVITDWLPNTGISLPFFSYGGSSLIMLLAQMGLVLSISRTANIERQ